MLDEWRGRTMVDDHETPVAGDGHVADAVRHALAFATEVIGRVFRMVAPLLWSGALAWAAHAVGVETLTRVARGLGRFATWACVGVVRAALHRCYPCRRCAGPSSKSIELLPTPAAGKNLCGWPTKRGTPCRLLKGSCPHHGGR